MGLHCASSFQVSKVDWPIRMVSHAFRLQRPSVVAGADARSSAAARGRGDTTVADCNMSTVILLVRCAVYSRIRSYVSQKRYCVKMRVPGQRGRGRTTDGVMMRPPTAGRVSSVAVTSRAIPSTEDSPDVLSVIPAPIPRLRLACSEHAILVSSTSSHAHRFKSCMRWRFAGPLGCRWVGRVPHGAHL